MQSNVSVNVNTNLHVGVNTMLLRWCNSVLREAVYAINACKGMNSCV